MKGITITIDGPAAAGKSSVARQAAQALGYLYIDTGAMYRCLTYKLIRDGIDLDDEDAIQRVMQTTIIHINNEKAYLDGVNVTEEIRSPHVTKEVSKVSAYPSVRLAMVEQQREMAKYGSVILDGRDTGSFVLPDAELKIFLTASIEARAKRRYKEMQRKQNNTMTLEEVERDLIRRDNYDSTRLLAPLTVPHNALMVDTSTMTLHDAVNTIVEAARKVMRSHTND